MLLRGKAWFRSRSGHPAAACAIAVLCALLAAVAPAGAQPSEEEQAAAKSGNGALPKFQELVTEFKKLGDWDDQAETINETIERYWEENEWNTEADQFAKKTATEVAGIPPWNVTGRIGRMTELVSERYAFTEAQHRRFQSSTYAELGAFVLKNHKVLWSQTKDFVSMRSSGQPFTAEMIARQTRESDPLLADMRERLDRMVKSLEKTMTPRQREILRRDLESLQRRRVFTDRLRQRWADGGWGPRDWGLEKDPAYANWHPDPRQQQLLRRRAAIRAARERRERVQAVDETTWERYVRQFVEKYQLDKGQTRTAYSILRELQGRARDYRETHREEIAHVPRYRLADDPIGEPLRRMYEELKTRLQPIPTAAQHESADGKPG